MSRKVFLSFLGTNAYDTVKYTYQNHVFTTPYAPVASLQAMQTQDWIPDICYFFLTEEAEKAHWNAYAYTPRGAQTVHEPSYTAPQTEERIGLSATLESLTGSEPIAKRISNGETETEVWAIFRTMMDCLEEHDEVVLEVTLGFRIAPMLMFAFADYAHFVKNISVKAILYGSYQPWKDRENGQIWNMTSFVELQQWTRAADFFINTGNATELSKVLSQTNKYRAIGEKVEQVSKQFQTVRGRGILAATDMHLLSEMIAKYENTFEKKPVKDLLQIINNKIQGFQHNPTKNLDKIIDNTLQSVVWCIEHDLTQQGFTFLQEGIQTIVLCILQKDMNDYKWRTAASAAFTCWQLPYSDWLGKDEHKQKLNILLAHSVIFEAFNAKENSFLYKAISDARNSMNHGGFTDGLSPKELQDKLKKYYKQTQSILKNR